MYAIIDKNSFDPFNNLNLFFKSLTKENEKEIIFRVKHFLSLIHIPLSPHCKKTLLNPIHFVKWSSVCYHCQTDALFTT